MFRIFLVILVILISGSIAEPLAKAYGDTVGNTVLVIIIISDDNYDYNFCVGDHHNNNHHYICWQRKGRIVSISWTRSKFNYSPASPENVKS